MPCPSTLGELHNLVKSSETPIAALHVGEITEYPPPVIQEATRVALKCDPIGYTESRGIYELREFLASDLSARKDIPNITHQHLILTPGVKQGIYYVLHQLLRPNYPKTQPLDAPQIIIPTPAWCVYGSQIAILGGQVCETPLTDTGQLDLTHLQTQLGPHTRGILLCSPHNPTGGILDQDTLRGLAQLLESHPHVSVISDEIYEGLDYEGVHVSAASLDGLQQRCYTLGGFSKLYCMTGYRLGWIAAPTPEKAAELAQLQSTICTCPNTLSQRTAFRAVWDGYSSSDTAVRLIRQLDARRQGLLTLWGDWVRGNPRGAFYLWVALPEGYDDLEVTGNFLEKGVAIAAGSYFGYPGFLRISYACSFEDYQRAMGVFQEFIKEARTGNGM